MLRPPHVAATTHSSGDSNAVDTPICYFLDALPRELREMVYSYLGADFTAVKPTPICDSTSRLKDGPRLAVLLVNKQVRAEYWKMCKEMTQIVVVDAYAAGNITCPEIHPTMALFLVSPRSWLSGLLVSRWGRVWAESQLMSSRWMIVTTTLGGRQKVAEMISVQSRCKICVRGGEILQTLRDLSIDPKGRILKAKSQKKRIGSRAKSAQSHAEEYTETRK
ncbi:uncharacterized protein MYCFIDRAFT_199449 [Pseudocercospora fijiensis CIRAD86]|uniref:Uncharacterized protein n=1 Tax=Pseudocercospora fijiensis (strain CIRAD86) TaxID=383855 RepID=M2YQ01_PSEFD|nr:uncharacterized protein MYCFIDRAFT_199449 [Pseudocercospora fijiensis CIRAD86]EME79790.1 hypothetical protein MYCFIDRAFT_199449 [Pseudocercospora fijiensis CIRAD86]